MAVRAPIAAIAFLFLLLPLAAALFLVGEGKAGEGIPVLCENRSSVFVSSPGGSVQQVQLDSSFQAEFFPSEAGPHTFQCGNETRTANVEGQAASNAPEVKEENGMLLFAASVIFVLFFAAGSLLLARELMHRQTVFRKIVESKKARILLKAGREMKRIRITDPVAFGLEGTALEFSIASLAQGKEWDWEYELSEPENALPASLEAECGGEKISLLSELHIEGAGIRTDNEGKGARKSNARRKLPKAK